MRPSQNLPLPSEYSLPHPFLVTICDPPRSIYPSLPEYTPLFNTYLCDPLRIYPSVPEHSLPPFQQLCSTLPESTPPSQNIPFFNNYVRSSQNLPIPPSQNIPPFSTPIWHLPESTPPSQNIPPFSTTICDPPRIYPSLREYTPSLFSYYMRPSQNLPLPLRMYPIHF